jgi:hypothetical protein
MGNIFVIKFKFNRLESQIISLSWKLM